MSVMRLKRLIDVVVSTASLLLAGPILVVVGGIVRLRMGSPVLFGQTRPGLHGRPFTLYKFRTMGEGDGDDTDRLTSVGRFLRASSVDELPELINVLKGDMSLVGPRPLLMRYLDRYSADQARRHEMRPGLTGWAQVNGRNAITWEQKFDYDVWYVDHWSIALDIKIMWMTMKQVLLGTGVAAPGHATMPEFMGSDRLGESEIGR